MKVLFFGSLAEQLGRELEIDPAGARWTVGELRQLLCSRDSAFANALGNERVRACVDQVIVSDDAPVRPGQELAFIPPLSGG